MITSCLNKNDFTYKLLTKAYGEVITIGILLNNRNLDLSKTFQGQSIENIAVADITETFRKIAVSLNQKHERLLSESTSKDIKAHPPIPAVAEHIQQWLGVDIYNLDEKEVEISYEDLVSYIETVNPQSMVQLPLLRMLKENLELHKEKKEVFDSTKFKIVLARGEKYPSDSEGTVMGHITPDHSTIRLFYDHLGQGNFSGTTNKFTARFLKTLNHELIHAFTIYSYDHNREFKDQMDTLFNESKIVARERNLTKSDYYGLTDQYEFIAETLTNSEFQSFLATIPYDKKNPAISIWDKFLQLVSDFFFLQKKVDNINNTLLEASIVSITNRIESVRQSDKSIFTYEKESKEASDLAFEQETQTIYNDQVNKLFDYWWKTDVITKTKFQNQYWIKANKTNTVLLNKSKLSEENIKAIRMYGIPKFNIQKMGKGYTVEVNPEYVNKTMSSAAYKLSKQQGTQRDLKAAQRFLEKRFGKDMAIDIFNDTTRIGDDFAHGWFDAAGVHIWESSMVGTEYHEAFHVVFRLYNTNINQQALYEEARRIYGDKLSDLELEEKMADDFMSYAESRQDRSFLGKIMDFFKDLYNYLKSYITSKPQIKNIYSQIYSGMINKSFKRSLSSLGSNKVYKRVPGFTKEETTQIVDVAGRLFIKEKANKNAPKENIKNKVGEWFLLNAFTINGKALSRDRLDRDQYVDIKTFGPIVSNYWKSARAVKYADKTLETYPALLETFKKAAAEFGEFLKEQADKGKPILNKASTGFDENQLLQNSARFLDIYTNWKSIIEKETDNEISIGFEELLVDYLRNFGIEFIQKKTIEDNADESEELSQTEQTIEKIYNMSQLKEDLRKKLSADVKEFLRLIETEDVNFLGFKKLIDFEDIYLDIALTLTYNNSAGIYTGGFQGMIDALYEAGKTKPYLTTVADKLVNREKEPDGAAFCSKFYSSFNNIYHKFLTVVTEFEDVWVNTKFGEGKTVQEAKTELNIKIIETNRNALSKKLLKDYESNSIATEDKPNPKAIVVENKEGALTVKSEKVIDAVNLYNVFNNINDKTTTLAQKVEALSKFLNLFGATISSDHINKYIQKGINDVARAGKEVVTTHVDNEDLFVRLVNGDKEKKEIGLIEVLSHFVTMSNDRGKMSIDKDTDGNSKIQKEVSNVYSMYSRVFERFSTIEGAFAITDVGTFTDSMGKPIYPINLPTALAEYISNFKRGDIDANYYADKSFVPDEDSDGSTTRKSMFMHWFENPAIRDGIELFDFDAYKEKGEALATNDFQNLSDNTSFIVRMNMFLNNGENFGIFVLPTLGDRGRMLSIKVPRLGKMREFTTDTVNLETVIEGYLYQDLEAIWQANKDILPPDQGGLADDQLIEGYHYDKETDNKRDGSGRAFRFWNLSNVNVDTALFSDSVYQDNGNGTSTREERLVTLKNATKEQFMSLPKATRDTIINQLRDKYINEHIEKLTNKIIQDMIDFKVIEGAIDENGVFIGKDIDGKATTDVDFVHSLNKNALRKLYDADRGATANEMVRKIAKDFVINDIIVRNEITKITRARRGFTKSYEDFNKRFGAVLTPGFKLAEKGSFPSHPDWGMPATFQEACIFDLYNDYDQADALVKSMETLLEGKTLGHTKKYARGKVNKTDAFGVVNIHFGRSILQGQGAWTLSHEEAYKNYKAGKQFIDNQGKYPPLMPIKAYYDGMVFQNGRMVPVMIKNSYQILLRDYTKDHPQLDALRVKMEDPKRPIDAVNTVTTRKLERHGMADITTDNYNLVTSTLPSKYFRIPQVIPNKHDNPLIGSQFRKEILSNLMKDEQYVHEDWGERKVNGTDVFNAFSKVHNEMMQQDFDKLMNELNFNNVQQLEEAYVNDSLTTTERKALNEKRKSAQIVFLNNLRRKIKESVIDRDLSENYTEALKIIYDNLKDTWRYQVSLSFPAYGKKFNQILFSIYRNSVMQQRIKGMSAVQIAELGGWGFVSKETGEISDKPDLIKPKKVKVPSTFTFNDGISVETEFALNDQQKEALNEMDAFLKDKEKSTFALKGYAGTGKTSTVRYLLEHFRKSNGRLGGNVVFSSPTHRANAVLKQNLQDESVVTLHKAFGLAPDMNLEEFSAKDLSMTPKNDSAVHKGDLLIIDESSMINDYLYTFITNAVKTKGIKVIFMGDVGQLKPVKQVHVSKVFTDVKDSYQLTKVERTGDNPLLEEVTNIRNSNNPTEQLSMQTAVNEDGEGVTYTNNRNGILATAVDLFKGEEFKKDPLLVRILSYTNANVTGINKLIQKSRFGQKEGIDYYPGDIIMGYNNYAIDKDTQEAKIINGGDYLVTAVSDKKHTVYEGIELDYFNITIKDAIDKKKAAVTVRVLSKENSEEVFNAFGRVFEEKRNYALSKPKGSREARVAWGEFYSFKDAFATPYSCNYGISQRTGEPLVKIPKTFDLGYAHTIHKSQGGTYKYVIVDSTDIQAARDPQLEQQLKYVALSRAQEHAYVLTNSELKEPRIAVKPDTEKAKETPKVSEKTVGPEYLGFIKGKNGKVIAAECAIKWEIAEKFGLHAGQSLESIPEELRRIIAYRIPTQGKNSMIPFVIKYILPKNYDHAILVPGEITTQMGSDFDVDKLFIMQPNLHIEGINKFINNYLLKQGVEDTDVFWTDDLVYFRDNYKNSGNKPENTISGEEQLIIDAIDEFYRSVENINAKAYVTKIKPDWNTVFNSEDLSNLTRDDLENAMFDLSWSILTNPKHFADLIEPRDDDRLPKLAKGFRKDGYFGEEEELDFNYPLTEQVLEMRNKAGSKGIGIYANFLSGHNISQYTDIKLPNVIKVRYNGRYEELNSLHKTEDMDGMLIATNISAHLGIAVDNAKDPFMYFLNDNSVTSNITGLLLTLGVPIEGAAWFRMQPIIREFVKRVQLQNAAPFEYNEIKKQLFIEYGIDNKAVLDARKNDKDEIDIRLNINTKIPIDKEVTKDNSTEQGVLLDTFFDLNLMGTKLLRINKVLMADRISDMSSLGAIQNFEDIIADVSSLLDVESLEKDYPITYAYLQKGVRGAKDFFTKSGLFLNTLTENNVAIIKDSVGRDVVDSTVYDNFHKELLYYLFQMYPENRHIFTEAKFKELFGSKQNLVVKHTDLMNKVPKLLYNKFFNNFYTRYDKKTDYQILHFNSSLRLTTDQRNTFVDNFRDMLYNPQIYTEDLALQEEIRTFAENLIYANMWRFGFDTNGSSITDIIPMEWFSSKSYFRTMHSLNQSVDLVENGYADDFMDNFVLNNSTSESFLRGIKVNKDTIIRLKIANNKPDPNRIMIKSGTATSAFTKTEATKYFRLFNRKTKEFEVYKKTSKIIESKGTENDIDNFIVYEKMTSKGLVYRFKEYNVFESASNQVMETSDIQESQVVNNPEEFYNNSGGAVGADKVWDTKGRVSGVTHHTHYTVSEYDDLSSEHEKQIDNQYLETVKFLGRSILNKDTYAGKLVRRDMMQANASDAVFAVTELVKPTLKGRKGYVNKMSYSIPEGGTGYATARSILLGNPTYVFNQSDVYGNEIGWYQWSSADKDFIKVGTPILTKNYAGIGSQEINNTGVQAIQDVYNKTFGNKTSNTVKVVKGSIIKKDKQSVLNDLNKETTTETTITTDKREFQPLGDIVDFLRNLEAEDKKAMLETVRHNKTDIKC